MPESNDLEFIKIKYEKLSKRKKVTQLLEDINCTLNSIHDKTFLYNSKNLNIPMANKKKIFKDISLLVQKYKILNRLLISFFSDYTFIFFAKIKEIREQINKLEYFHIQGETWVYESLLRDLFINIYKFLFDEHPESLTVKNIHNDILTNKILLSCLKNHFFECLKYNKINSNQNSDFSSPHEDVKFSLINLNNFLDKIDNLFNKDIIKLIKDLRNQELCHNQSIKNNNQRNLEDIFKDEIINKKLLNDLFKTIDHINTLMICAMSWTEP